jgi:hypothetical protein
VAVSGASVARAEYIAGGGAEVQLELLAAAGPAERLPQHGQVGMRRRQTVAAPVRPLPRGGGTLDRCAVVPDALVALVSRA